MGRGRRNIISISKIKNRMANKKNRIEKGARALDVGSNPHSNDDDFSRSLLVWVLIILNTIRRVIGKTVTIRMGVIIVIN